MVLLISTMLISACSGIHCPNPRLNARVPVAEAKQRTGGCSLCSRRSFSLQSPANQPRQQLRLCRPPLEAELLAAYQQTLDERISQVGPSVVNIRVVESQSASALDSNHCRSIPGMPFFNNPNGNQNSLELPPIPKYTGQLKRLAQVLFGSSCHIVTNIMLSRVRRDRGYLQ